MFITNNTNQTTTTICKQQVKGTNPKLCVTVFLAGSSLRRGTPSDCHTDSNNSTTGGSNQVQVQQQNQQTTQHSQSQQQPAVNTQVTTHASFGEDESSCDSQSRWGKAKHKTKHTKNFKIIQSNNKQNNKKNE